MTAARSDRSRRARGPRRALGLAALALLGATSCTQQSVRGDSLVNLAPALSVERFLQASNARDYDAMARLFGNEGGPVADRGGAFGCAFRRMGSWIGLGSRCQRREEVELRMAAIADILLHQDYQIVDERQEPGRRALTNRVSVDLTPCSASRARFTTCTPMEPVRDVSFMVVRSGSGSWLIEEIELQKITGS
jgi:hypothetical protein